MKSNTALTVLWIVTALGLVGAAIAAIITQTSWVEEVDGKAVAQQIANYVASSGSARVTIDDPDMSILWIGYGITAILALIGIIAGVAALVVSATRTHKANEPSLD